VKKVPFQIRIPRGLHLMIVRDAKAQGKSQSTLAREIFEEHYNWKATVSEEAARARKETGK